MGTARNAPGVVPSHLLAPGEAHPAAWTGDFGGNTALPTFFPAHASLAVGHPSDY